MCLIPLGAPSPPTPQYKTKYFVKAGWKNDWVMMVKDILQDEWNVTAPNREASTSSQTGEDNEDMFARLDMQYEAMATTKLEAYNETSPSSQSSLAIL